MPWLILFFAGLFEVTWAIGLKYSHGLTKLWPSVMTIVALVLSLVLLGRALRDIPLGTAYAVWTGIGTIGAATYGILFFREPASWPRLACLALIIVGLVGLKVLTPPAPSGPPPGAPLGP